MKFIHLFICNFCSKKQEGLSVLCNEKHCCYQCLELCQKCSKDYKLPNQEFCRFCQIEINFEKILGKDWKYDSKKSRDQEVDPKVMDILFPWREDDGT